ncbi:ATP--cob(I)alamin adenosyltransferase [Spirochaetia bacterium]|nr:ATP--cob(I)alamin adenosyltransferase [Spirochaetia bacterium]
MSISTTTGDEGSTGLLGGDRVPKDHPRIECLGVLDELSAFLGDARCAAVKPHTQEIIETIQNELFTLGGILATPNKAANANPRTECPRTECPMDTQRLTAWVRELEAEFPIRDFTMPGTNPASAKLDIARTVCRRLERRMVALDRSEGVPGTALAYINRLSDLLFMLARLEGGGST